MDLTFLKDKASQLTRQEYNMEELQYLGELARYVGNYLWQYDGDNEVHEGVITQDLLRVPGLKDAVKVDPETGLQMLDFKFVASAALSAVAALCRAISGIEYAGPNTESDGSAEPTEQNI